MIVATEQVFRIGAVGSTTPWGRLYMTAEIATTRAARRYDVAVYLFAARALEAELNQQLQRRTGLPFLEFQILDHLVDAGGAMYMTDLASAMAMSKSRLSHAVSRIEPRGLVFRHDCASDARRIYTAVTDQGRDLHEQTAPVYEELCRCLALDRLTPAEVERLAATSSTLLLALQSPRVPSPRLTGSP